MHSRAWVKTCGAMPCSCCRIRHCSSVTDMAVRSLALLQLVNRTPLRRRQICQQEHRLCLEGGCRMETHSTRDTGSGGPSRGRGDSSVLGPATPSVPAPQLQGASCPSRGGDGERSLPWGRPALPHRWRVPALTGCSFTVQSPSL